MADRGRRVKSVPLAGVIEEFDVPPPTGRGVMKTIRGLRTEDGGTFYRCTRDECAKVMYETVQAVMAHAGDRHPSAATVRRREARAGLRGAAKVSEAPPRRQLGRTPKPKHEPEPAESPGGQLELMAVQVTETPTARMLPALNRQRGRNSRKPMNVEDTLDFMGSEIVKQTTNTVDLILQSRDANRKLYLETLEELERTKRQLEHALKAIGKIREMASGVFVVHMGTGEENDGQ